MTYPIVKNASADKVMDDTALAQVRIILVEPIGPLNVGSVARVMKNMGLRQLVLVKPQCDPLGEEARKMALHAVDVLEAAQQVETLPEALRGCQRAIATTARERRQSMQLENPRIALPWLIEAGPSALIFGSEDRGLTNSQLQHAQRFVQIPSSDAYPALNLAQAVAVCCYELYQSVVQAGGSLGQGENAASLSSQGLPLSTPPLSHVPTDSPTTAASLEALEAYYQQLEALLLKIGYLYPHTAASRMVKFRLLFNRTQPSTAEVAMLRGIVRQMEWALQNRVECQIQGADYENESTFFQPYTQEESEELPSVIDRSEPSTDL